MKWTFKSESKSTGESSSGETTDLDEGLVSEGPVSDETAEANGQDAPDDPPTDSQNTSQNTESPDTESPDTESETAFDADGEGPLDPSVFFGLFDNLDNGDKQDSTEATDRPILLKPADEGLGGLTGEAPLPPVGGLEDLINTEVHEGGVNFYDVERTLVVEPPQEPEAAKPVAAPGTDAATSSEDSVAGEDLSVEEGSGFTISSTDSEAPTNMFPPEVPPLEEYRPAQTATPSQDFATTPFGNGWKPKAHDAQGAAPSSVPMVKSPATNEAVVLGQTDAAAEVAPSHTPAGRSIPHRDQPTSTDDRTSSGPKLRTLLLTIGAGLLFGLLGALFVTTRGDSPSAPQTQDDVANRDTDASNDANESTNAAEDQSILSGEEPVTDGSGEATVLTPQITDLVSNAVNNDRVDLTGLRFIPGTVELTGPSQNLLDGLATTLNQSGSGPTTISVRTYSEPSVSENLQLSQQQAGALELALTNSGVPDDQVVAVGLGSGPLSPQQPVPDFIAISPEFGDNAFTDSLGNIGSFMLGSNPGAARGNLRLEGQFVAGQLGRTMSAFDDSQVGLAAYSFSEPNNNANRENAASAADTVVGILTEVHGLDPARVNVITTGPAPFIVTPEVGNHIWVQSGPSAQAAFDVATATQTPVAFETGTAQFTESSGPTLDAIAAALEETADIVVIDVRSYSQETTEENLELSQLQADRIAEYLLASGGVQPDQVRVFGSGASSYFRRSGAPDVTMTVVPT